MEWRSKCWSTLRLIRLKSSDDMDTHLSLRQTGWRYAPPGFTPATASACAAARRIGPMTREQLIQLIWRVREIEISGSISFTNFTTDPDAEDPTAAGDSETLSIDRTCIRIISGEVAFSPVARKNFLEENMGKAGSVTLEESGSGASFILFVDKSKIYKDEVGKFWLEGGFNAKTPSPDLRATVREALETDALEPDINFTGSITLLGTPVDFPMETFFTSGVYSVESASATIAPSAFYPYATTAGAAAWNTSTGAPANGGPGS